MWQIIAPLALVLISVGAHAQRTNRLGGEPVLFPDESSYALINVNFAPLVSAESDTSTTPGYPGVASLDGFGVDARATLAWVFDARWVFGFSYDRYQLRGHRRLVAYGQDALERTTTRDEWGPTVGWSAGGWRILFTYFVGGSRRSRTTTNDYRVTTSSLVMKSQEMDGFQLALGYSFHLFGRVHLGPVLVYRAVNYHVQSRANEFSSADSYGNQRLYRADRQNTLRPLVALDLRF